MEMKQMKFLTHQAFFSSVRSGDLSQLQQLVDNLTGDELIDESSPCSAVAELMSVQNDAGETAVYISAAENLEDIFRYLIRFSSLETVKIRSKSDMNAFHVAAKRGHLGIVKELLRLWPELCRICDASNTSPLYAAAVQDHLEIVNAMLDVDPSCAMIVRKNGKTSLHTAGRYGLLRIVKALIEKDAAIVGVKDKKGQTALHMAVKGRSLEVVEEILQADYTILNERDRKGNTALHIATRKARPQITSLLLTFTAIEVNAINNQKETAMDLADKLQYSESALEINEALVEAGAKHGRFIGREDEARALKRAVSDIKHEVQSQLLQNEKTNRRVSGIAKELRKLHREAVQNTTNSITVVAVLFASIAFLAIFNLPGQYFTEGSHVGQANIAGRTGFRVFCLLNATSLFISLAVVVVQITTGSTEIVVLCHGFRSTKNDQVMKNVAAAIEKEGISAFRFDFSGNGESKGSFYFGNYNYEADDLHSVIRYFTNMNRVVPIIIGHSKGGDVVLVYASKYQDIRNVINLSGRYDLKRGIGERLGEDYLERIKQQGFIDIKEGNAGFRVTEESLMERLNTDMHEACLKIDKECRVLTVHGSADEVIPLEDAKEFAKIIPNHKLEIVHIHRYNHYRSR